MSNYLHGYNRVMKAAAVASGASALRKATGQSSTSKKRVQRPKRTTRKQKSNVPGVGDELVGKAKGQAKSDAIDTVDQNTSVNLSPLKILA